VFVAMALLMLGVQQEPSVHELHRPNGNQLPVWLQYWRPEPASWRKCQWWRLVHAMLSYTLL